MYLNLLTRTPSIIHENYKINYSKWDVQKPHTHTHKNHADLIYTTEKNREKRFFNLHPIPKTGSFLFYSFLTSAKPAFVEIYFRVESTDYIAE